MNKGDLKRKIGDLEDGRKKSNCGQKASVARNP